MYDNIDDIIKLRLNQYSKKTYHRMENLYDAIPCIHCSKLTYKKLCLTMIPCTTVEEQMSSFITVLTTQ